MLGMVGRVKFATVDMHRYWLVGSVGGGTVLWSVSWKLVSVPLGSQVSLMLGSRRPLCGFCDHTPATLLCLLEYLSLLTDTVGPELALQFLVQLLPCCLC